METMLDYIYEEEQILSKIIEKHTFIKDDKLAEIRSLLILATGSSYNACLSAKIALEQYADITVTIEEPYNFNHYGKISETVDAVLAVSQSGRSTSTVDAISKLKAQGLYTLALTSDPESPISRVVDRVIDLDMGIEKVGFVTKGYVVTLLQLILLGISIGMNKCSLDAVEWEIIKAQLIKITANIPDTIRKTDCFFEKHKSLFKVANRFVAIGYGPNWGTVKEFETKFTETVRKPSQGFELEAYMHGPYLEANCEHLLFFIETKSENQKRSEKLRVYMEEYVGQTFTVTTNSGQRESELGLDIECDEILSQLILVIPFQILAYKIATAKEIDLSKRIFDDFDDVLKSKI